MNGKNIRIIDTVKDADALIEILSTGAVFPLVVTGSSMRPFLREGRDTVSLRKTDTLRKGQIVFFRSRGGGFTLHRIRKIYRDGRLLINGDAQWWCEIVFPAQVLAEVISITRNDKIIDPCSLRQKLLNSLWYPTRPIRPFIWKVCGFLRKYFKKR
jgi:hypothetical protein